jgi:ABC-type uncharacterized transport system substrate-binding protein
VLSKVTRYTRPSSWVAAIARSLFFLFALACSLAAQSNELKRVLILTQEDLSWPAFRLIDENARTTLRRGSPAGILIFTEHMDRIHFPDPEFQGQQVTWIQKKYAKSKIDLVSGVGDVPTEMFPSVPLLYLGADPLQKRASRLASSKDAVGIWVGLDVQKTVEVARQLQPGARRVVVIGGSSPADNNFLDQVRDQIARESDQMPTIYMTNLTFPEICKRISVLGPESIMLFVTLGRDGGGHPFISAEVISKIAAVSGASVYVLLDTNIGSGAAGGYVSRFAELGKQAGEKGLQILAGEHPKDAMARSDYVVDWRQLRRWKISESSLPPGSVLLYRQPTLWESYIISTTFLVPFCCA